MKFRFSNLIVISQMLVDLLCSNVSFVDKSDISVKSRENVLLPYQEDGLLSSTLTKRNDAEPAKKKLFVGMWQINNVLSKPSS